MKRLPIFPLTVFYDGACSVCSREMARYRRAGHGGRLIFVDIAAAGFDPAAYGRSREAFQARLHARDAEGYFYCGVEAFWAIWQALPSLALHALGRLLMLPPVTPLARLGYACFARLRRYLPRRRDPCDGGSCHLH